MELNRATITGQTFPQAADGYDRLAVARHLAAIADAVEQSADAVDHTVGPVGADAGEQMRSIVEGAESSARALRETAQREADGLREAARREALAVRETAAREAGDQVAAARAAVTSLLERVGALGLGVEDSRRHVMEAAEAMAQRLNADSEPLVATLRNRARALGAELDLIGTGLAAGVVEAARERGVASEDEPAPAAGGMVTPPEAASEEPGTGLATGDLDEAAHLLDEQESPAGAADGAPAGAPGTEDGAPVGAMAPGTERARLVALNMAVSGTPRAEADRHLREELSIEDPSTILDEVYARAEREE